MASPEFEIPDVNDVRQRSIRDEAVHRVAANTLKPLSSFLEAFRRKGDPHAQVLTLLVIFG